MGIWLCSLVICISNTVGGRCSSFLKSVYLVFIFLTFALRILLALRILRIFSKRVVYFGLPRISPLELKGSGISWLLQYGYYKTVRNGSHYFGTAIQRCQLIQVFGVGVLAVGIWSWSEKDTFSNLNHVTRLFLDPAFILIIIGAVTFFIGFTGCIGALREIPALLTIAVFTIALIVTALLIFDNLYIGTMLIVLFFEIAFVVILTNFKDWIKAEASDGFQTFIIHYREDPDQQNLIDWVQEDWLQCCGIEGPKDWDKNNYFNCSSQDIGSREACGVPFSCCKRKPNEIVKNKQCGYDVRKSGYYGDKQTSLLLTQDEVESPIYEQGCIKAMDEWMEKHYLKIFGTLLLIIFIKNYDVAKIIYEKGCIQALEEWIEHYLLYITMAVIISTFVKLVAVLLTQNFKADVELRKEDWH